MTLRMTFRMAALAGLVAVSAIGCSTTGAGTSRSQLTTSSLCTNAGGTYADGTCTSGDQTRTAQQLCEAHKGAYFSGGDYCEVEGIWRP
jgi:hypothetical protein